MPDQKQRTRPDDAGRRIHRREFLKTSATAVAMAGTVGLGQAKDLIAPGKRPNIVFVFSDEHRWCSLPFTEMPQVVAPNMERLAGEGTRFDNCCSTSAICVPYRGMLITGQWPHQSSCISNDYFGDGDVIGINSPTIAHTFKGAGYTTGYIGKWHLTKTRRQRMPASTPFNIGATATNIGKHRSAMV
ncbi:MAG: hypothetical protein DRP71_16080 [Verrucomicrobia bacterium]|nr:MAG: hypothetical protein DRP71_16080 [Verrucomicrobiota bacterium]